MTHQKFFVKTHIFLGHDALDFGKNNMFLAKIISEKNVFCLNFISAVRRLLVTAEIIAHYRNFSKIDAPGQKYAGTVIRTIERNHFTASFVHRNLLYDEHFLHRKYR